MHTKITEPSAPDSYASKRLFAQKIAHYAQRDPKHFLQLDGFHLPNGGDDLQSPDEDGDCLEARATVELMSGATVRVLVPHGVDRLVAIRQLKKLTKWLTRHPDLMDYANPATANTHIALNSEVPF